MEAHKNKLSKSNFTTRETEVFDIYLNFNKKINTNESNSGMFYTKNFFEICLIIE